MSGNKNSGRKPLEKPSVEYRFRLSAKIDELIVEKAAILGVSPNKVAKDMIEKHFNSILINQS